MITNTKPNIVIDTNQFLSGFLYNGMMRPVFDLVLEGKLSLYASSALQAEILQKLGDFGVAEKEQKEIMTFITMTGIFREPAITITACRDQKDNFLLELVETAKADYLITRDKDLLALPKSRWKKTRILKPEDFLPILREKPLLQ